MVVAGALLRTQGLSVFAPGNEAIRAALVALPTLWVLKLAIAEAFRRPETALVPRRLARLGRGPVGLGLALLALALASQVATLAVVAGGWAGLVLLDGFAARRAGPGGRRSRWRYLRPVALGSSAAAMGLAALALGGFA